MARNRAISPDFWTWEAVIDRAMTDLSDHSKPYQLPVRAIVR